MKHRKYTLTKFIEEDEIRVRDSYIPSEKLDNSIKDILDKTEDVATRMEDYIRHLNKFQDAVDKRWQEHGINFDEIMQVANTVQTANKRIDGMLKRMKELEGLNDIQEQLISYLQDVK